MIKKQYKYNDTIQKDHIIDLFKQFKEELIEKNVKYIELNIYIIPQNLKNVEVNLIKDIKVNIQSQMLGFMRVLKKNSAPLNQHFTNSFFTELVFEYKEISYSKYISVDSSRYFKNKNILKSFIKKIKNKK